MDLFDDFARRAAAYRGAVDNSRVYPGKDAISRLQRIREPLQDDPLDASVVLSTLDEFGSPATVRSAGGRYFGFVTGSSVPGAMLSQLMATVWDQNAALAIMSPVASLAEEVSAGWLLSLLGLPDGTATSFVTGATMANFTALAAARHYLSKNLGWDIPSKGMFGAPEIKVIVGDEVHVSLLKALSLLGFGRERVVRVPTDDQGRIIADGVADDEGPAIVCLQAGNVNSGASDPIGAISRRIKKENVWVHVDGAFGLWAAASPEKKHLVDGIELADSWATDAHKWLNVPYDSGLAFVRQRQALIESMSATAAYLPETSSREPMQYVPEMSRQARGIAVWGRIEVVGEKRIGGLDRQKLPPGATVCLVA
jgi:glutamate/tyrosine decarboxylase-like PLP-dependent enzyme